MTEVFGALNEVTLTAPDGRVDAFERWGWCGRCRRDWRVFDFAECGRSGGCHGRTTAAVWGLLRFHYLAQWRGPRYYDAPMDKYTGRFNHRDTAEEAHVKYRAWLDRGPEAKTPAELREERAGAREVRWGKT